MTLAMIPTYGGVLSAIEEALRELIAEYRGVGKSLQDLVEDQERNTAQLERIGAVMEQRCVIRRECGQTLARVRVSRTYISIIIISLQRT